MGTAGRRSDPDEGLKREPLSREGPGHGVDRVVDPLAARRVEGRLGCLGLGSRGGGGAPSAREGDGRRRKVAAASADVGCCAQQSREDVKGLVST